MSTPTGIRLASIAAAIALLTAAASEQSPAHSTTPTGSGSPSASNVQITDAHADSGDHGNGAHGDGAHGESDHGDAAHGDAEMPEMEGHSTEGHSTEGHDSGTVGEHSHGTLAILEGQPAPEVALTVHDDDLKGWNLEIEVENFTLAPEEVNQASNTIEGHAHLYVNGVKVTRLYGPWFYLESLPSGEHELRVELNANGHEVLMYEGEAIAATAVVTVP